MFEKLLHYRDCAYNPSLFTQEEKDSFFCMLTALFVILAVGVFEFIFVFAKNEADRRIVPFVAKLAIHCR